LRTKARYAGAIRARDNGARDAGAPELTPTELLAVTTIAYLQPATRGELSRLIGKDVSRDIIARLKSLDLIAAGPHAPEPGVPYAYVTTRKFLEVFGLASLRDLPDIESLEDAGLLQRPANEIDLDGMLGIREDAAELVDGINLFIVPSLSRP
jgi:segregation and condensation protein B